MPDWLEEFLPIVILLAAVAVVIARLPKVEGLDYSAGFRRRRVFNWVPLGLTYAFLYMGRYNLKVSQSAFGGMQDAAGNPVMANADFATIFLVGTVVYGISFVLNGPLTDRFGGKRAILLGAGGAALANLLMGLATWSLVNHGPAHVIVAEHFVLLFSLLYALNMYFQSFGAVAIVKVNAPWFNVRERGVIGAVFGILISLGVYFAFDWSKLVLKHLSLEWVFLVPACILAVFWVIDVFVVKERPSGAGFADIDLGDATSGEEGPPLKAVKVFKMMLRNPIIMTIACIEFCSGFLRQAIMQWYQSFARQTDAVLGLMDGFVNKNWGMLLCAAGILGGVFAGVISDHVFQSRRGPVAGILYGILLLGAIVLTFTYRTAIVGWLVVAMSLAVIGVHGMLSGTASMDFGGSRNAGIAVGIIDGFVYLGTGFMSLVYGVLLPKDQLDAAGRLTGPATNPDNWLVWPLAMIPMAVIGFVLALLLWNAKPRPKTTGGSG
ncbi:MAG: MFS transporter [Deltaproteobacteria bacterium]|nr:MAG: MFS transporter [Deltaproteobacteria bacterium]